MNTEKTIGPSGGVVISLEEKKEQPLGSFGHSGHPILFDKRDWNEDTYA